jgi:hypothetical protein
VPPSTLGEYRGCCQKWRFLSGKSPTGAGSASTVLVAWFCGRRWFAQGLEVWRILLGYHFKCVRDSGEQRQEFVHTNFRHGPRFYRITVGSGGATDRIRVVVQTMGLHVLSKILSPKYAYRAGRPSSASSISGVSRPICTAKRTTSLRVRSPSF